MSCQPRRPTASTRHTTCDTSHLNPTLSTLTKTPSSAALSLFSTRPVEPGTLALLLTAQGHIPRKTLSPLPPTEKHLPEKTPAAERADHSAEAWRVGLSWAPREGGSRAQKALVRSSTAPPPPAGLQSGPARPSLPPSSFCKPASSPRLCRVSAAGTGSSRCGEQGPLSSCAAGLTACPTACGVFPGQGSNPCPPYWLADSQPPSHQGGLQPPSETPRHFCKN